MSETLPTRTITATLTQTGDTITLEIPNWPGGPFTLTHNSQTGTVLNVTGDYTQVVDGNYTLIVNGSHSTFVRKHTLMRTLGHAITFTSKTIQHNPLTDRMVRYITAQETAAARLLARLFPALNTEAVVADKRTRLFAIQTSPVVNSPTCTCHNCLPGKDT